VTLDRVTGTTYLDSTAQPGINDYRVQAYDSDGAIGLASAIVTIIVPRVERSTAVTPQPQGTLAAPAGLHVVAGLWHADPALDGGSERCGLHRQARMAGERTLRRDRPHR